MKVKLTFIEPLLGTASANPDIHRDFIASHAPDAPSRTEEVEAIGVDETVEKSMTVFPREEGKPFLWDYQVKGFFKDACAMLSRVKTTKSAGLKAFRKVIDGLVFVGPRKIMMSLPSAITTLQRPLRAQTAQGERVALANSECAPAGTTVECEITLLDEKLEKVVTEWLDYGKLRGIGQWRNSGMGRFTWELA